MSYLNTYCSRKRKSEISLLFKPQRGNINFGVSYVVQKTTVLVKLAVFLFSFLREGWGGEWGGKPAAPNLTLSHFLAHCFGQSMSQYFCSNGAFLPPRGLWTKLKWPTSVFISLQNSWMICQVCNPFLVALTGKKILEATSLFPWHIPNNNIHLRSLRDNWPRTYSNGNKIDTGFWGKAE